MIIRDSSSNNFSKPGMTPEAGQLRIGIVRTSTYDSETSSFTYGVEAYSHGRRVYMRCRQLSRFGDAWNFEEWGVRAIGTTTPALAAEEMNFASKPGEVVVVAAISGIDMDGVIVGSLLHPSRDSKMKDGEQAYYSNYNGVETSIDSDGAYTIKFNGKPTNTLLTAFGGTLPKPTYNSTIAGSLISIEKDGSFVVGDGSKQALRIDKSKTSTTITSGNTVITLDGKGEKLQATSKAVTIEAKDTFKLSSKEALVECTSSIKIKAPKIAIGTSGVELLDHIVQLIDAIGTIVINSPVGPCQPIKTSPMWTQIEALKVKVKSITGSL